MGSLPRSARQLVTGAGAFRNGQTAGTSYTDTTGGSYEALNTYQQGSVAGGYVVQSSGESLRSVALQLWGDASLWYKLAEANRLSADAGLIEGQRLSVPAGVTRSSYNADTLKPYDANDVIGNVSPTTPKPKKNNKCGVFGQILLLAVAIAVTAVLKVPIATALNGGTAAAAGSAASIGGAVAAGAAGSVVSQGVGIATGIQEKFSFGAVAMAGIGGAVSGGITIGGIADKFASAAVNGAVRSALTQGIGVATGLQSKFSWTGVAAAGIGAGVGQYAGANTQSLLGRFGSAVAGNSAGAMAMAATRSALSGGTFGDNLMRSLPDAIGNTIGGLVADRISRGGRGGTGEPTNLLAGTLYDGPGAGDSGAANLTYESGVPQNGRDGPLSADTAYGGGGAGPGAGGSPAAFATRPFVVSSDAEQLAITTASTATRSAPFPDAAQAEYQQWVAANGMKASPAEWAAESQYLTSKYLPAGYAAQGAADWADFAKAYQNGAVVSLTLTYPVQSEVSPISQLDGQLMTSTTGAFLWGELNGGSFGIAGAFDRTGTVQAAADRHPYAQYAGVGASMLVGGIGSVGKVGVAESSISRAVRLGREGEIAAGITGPKVGVTINGRLRFPDEMTPTLIKEVKNVGRQGWTRQLRDYSDLARSEGKTFELWVRENTVLTRNLRVARDQRLVIIRKELPGR